MIYVLHGEDSFSAAEMLGALVEAVGPPDMRESNVSTMEAKEFSVEKLGALSMVMPFLAERRVVVLRGVMGSLESRPNARRGRDRPEPVPRGFHELLPALPPTSDVIFSEAAISTSNPLLTAVKEAGGSNVSIHAFRPLDEDALSTWINDRVSREDATIDRAAVSRLVDQIGANLWTMNSEIQKLAVYCNGRTISIEDVEILVASAKETNMFAMVDAIMDRKPSAALTLSQKLLDEGKSGQELLAMIARQTRLIAIAQELASLRVPQIEWRSRLGTTSNFVVRKTAEQAKRFPATTVRTLYRLLLGADVAMKSGTSPDLAITEMLAEASTLHGTPRNRR